jgi:hypothetical protein
MSVTGSSRSCTHDDPLGVVREYDDIVIRVEVVEEVSA